MKKKSNPVKNVMLLLSIGIGLSLALGFYLAQEDLGKQLPAPGPDALYKQSDKTVEARVADLLSRMTLEEKIGQMSLVDKNSLKDIDDISRYNLGGVLSGAGAKPADNSIKGWFDQSSSFTSQKNNTRLKIPVLYGVDANHGNANVPGATVFPHAISLGASNNADLTKQIAKVTAIELVSSGINWNYSPSLDAPKDVRWGRVYETFSDDPNIIANQGSAYINGTQDGPSGVLASAKHYIATGSMAWDSSNHKSYRIDQGKVPENEQDLRQYYLPPYKSAVDSGVASIMIGLTEYGPNRVIDNKYLITDLLKDELGFKGFTVSDWYGVYEYADKSKYDANVLAINSGLDMAMLPFNYKDFLKDVRKAVNKGDIPIERVDDAVARILKPKFESGLFDSKPVEYSEDNIGSIEHRQLARRAVSSSAVLLKNQSVLPLKSTEPTILVAGSGADNVGRQSGAWTVEWQGIDGNWLPGSTSILKGIQTAVSSSSTVLFNESGMFTEKSRVGIVVVSEKPYAEGYGDNEYPTVSKEDLEAIKNMKNLADKVVVVTVSGRPLFITDYIDNWDAVVSAWLPGSEGEGLADVLFGKVKFSAKLPLPWPKNTEQLPIKNDGSTANTTKPLFERGFGL